MILHENKENKFYLIIRQLCNLIKKQTLMNGRLIKNTKNTFFENINYCSLVQKPLVKKKLFDL